MTSRLNHTTGYASQHIWWLYQARIKWEGSNRKDTRCRNGAGDDGGGSLISPDGVASIRMVGVSASVIFPCAIKVQKKIFFWHQLTQVVPEFNVPFQHKYGYIRDEGSPGKGAVKRWWWWKSPLSKLRPVIKCRSTTTRVWLPPPPQPVYGLFLGPPG